MNKKTLEESFSDFVFSLYSKRPNELPEAQVRDLKFAFMAGVVVTNEAFMSTTDLPENEGFKMLDSLQLEITMYAESLNSLKH